MIGAARLLGGSATAIAIAGAAVLLPAMILPVAGAPQAVVVMFMKRPDVTALPSDVAIVDWQAGLARLDNVDARAARALYGLGALLILPMRASGCMALGRR
jgi:hypothetical protein